MKFSQKEKKDLLFAGLMISLAFAILLNGGYPILSKLNNGFIIIFAIAFFTSGIGFLLHEIMHKYVAQSYGLFAEFKAFYKWLWFAVIASFFGFIIAAPGAVFIKGRITKDKNGKISFAGPLTNIVLSAIFLVAILFINPASVILKSFLGFGLKINSLLAVFNMIPAVPFDGKKVYLWNKKIYYSALISGIGLFVISWFI